MFRFSDLVLEHISFEVRYNNAYLYLDHCGKTCRKIMDKYPKVTVDMAGTDGAVLQMHDNHITLNFSHANAVITQRYPPNVSMLGEFSEFAINTICEFFEIPSFTRVGNRFDYMLKSEEAASLELMKKTGFLNFPEEKVSLMGDAVKTANVSFQIIKDGTVGYSIRMGHAVKNLNVQVPFPIKYNDEALIRSGLSINVDSFTLNPIGASNIKAHTLIKKNFKDMEPLITGIFK